MWFLLLACTENSKNNQDDTSSNGTVDSGDSTADTTLATEWTGTGLLQSAGLRESSHNPLAVLVDVTVQGTATVNVRWDCDGRGSSQSAEVVGSGTLSVFGVRANTACVIQVEADDGTGLVSADPLGWTSGSIPSDVPSMDLTVNTEGAVQSGTTLIGLTGDNRESSTLYSVGVDTEGEVVWLYVLESIGVAGQDHYVRVLGDGNLMLMLNEKVRMVTPAGETLYEIGSSELGEISHDALPLPNGDMLFITDEIRTLDLAAFGGSTEVQGDKLIRMTPDNEIVWTWSTFDHLDTERYPGQLSTGSAIGSSALDWTHGNAITLADSGSSVLFSSRSQSWIMKISLDTGDIGWIFGKDGHFNLTSGSWMYNQHAPELEDDGTLLVYDNGNERPEGASTRVVRYAMDEITLEASEQWSWEAPVYTDRVGDANLLENGDVLVNLGAPVNGDPTLVEVNSAGEVVWQLELGGGQSYRAERAPW